VKNDTRISFSKRKQARPMSHRASHRAWHRVMWKENYYINTKLMNLFIEFGQYEISDNDNSIESVHVKEKKET